MCFMSYYVLVVLIVFYLSYYLTRQVIEEQVVIYTGQNRTKLGQLCAALWDSFTASCDTAWTPLALRCSALDRCATRAPQNMLPLGSVLLLSSSLLLPGFLSSSTFSCLSLLFMYIYISDLLSCWGSSPPQCTEWEILPGMVHQKQYCVSVASPGGCGEVEQARSSDSGTVWGGRASEVL